MDAGAGREGSGGPEGLMLPGSAEGMSRRKANQDIGQVVSVGKWRGKKGAQILPSQFGKGTEGLIYVSN